MHFQSRLSKVEETDVVIIGAGPVGLFAVFELGTLNLKATLFDSLPMIGGQCAELYPEKPIYDIPAWPVITGADLVARLMDQIRPFDPKFHLGSPVNSIERLDDGRFLVRSDDGVEVIAHALFIAAGWGQFVPRKAKIANMEQFEQNGLYYSVKNRSSHIGKHVTILGGGDSALDWTLDLLPDVASMTLIHRRDRFKAAPASVDAMKAAVNEGKMKFIQGEPVRLLGREGRLTALQVKSGEGDALTLKTDHVLAFYGLQFDLGFLGDWGLDLHENKQIKVDTEHFSTNIPGVFAMGDICWYPGKLGLILSGFHEAALASKAAFAIARPNDKFIFRYTTSSSELHRRLKVNER